MKIYRILTLLLILSITLPINNYRNNWLGISKSGIISGQVLSVVNDQPIEGALVKVLKNGRMHASVLTNSNGFFKIPGLPAENYHVVAESGLYGSLTIESVPVQRGNEVVTHFILTPKYTIQ